MQLAAHKTNAVDRACSLPSIVVRTRRNVSNDSIPKGSAPPSSTSTRDTVAPASKIPVPNAASSRGPVSWRSLFLVGVTAASAVAYYQVERERRLEEAMGKIVSSESDDAGWTPRPDYLAKRKFFATKYGWFPQKDGFGAREFRCWRVWSCLCIWLPNCGLGY